MISLNEKKKLTKKERRTIINKIKVRAKNYKEKYGISIAQYNKLYELQEGKCATCDKPEANRYRPGIAFMVDHDHRGDIINTEGISYNGHVRGLLCYNCNLMLGHAFDNPNTLRKAADYLEKDKNKFVKECPGFIISTVERKNEVYKPQDYYETNGIRLKHNRNSKNRVIFKKEVDTILESESISIQ